MQDRNNKPDEVWVVLKQGGDTYNRYKVSNYGRVWDMKNDAEVSQVITGKPEYKYVNLYKDNGKRVLRRVNNIVSWTFHGEPPTPKHTSDHIDRDKFNNVEWNLRWLDKRGQAHNQNTIIRCEDGTPLVQRIREYCEENNLNFTYARNKIGDIYKEYGDFGLSIKYYYYSEKYPFIWKHKVEVGGSEYLLIDICEQFGLDFMECKNKISKGFSVCDIINGYTYKTPHVPKNVIDYSIETEFEWFPNKASFCKRFDLTEGDYKQVKIDGLLEYLNKKKIKEVFGIDPREVKDTIEEGNFYKGSLYRVCKAYGRCAESYKLSGLTLQQYLTKPDRRVTLFHNNGVWYTMKELSELTGVNVCLVTSRINKGFDVFQAITPYRFHSYDKIQQSLNCIFLINGEYWWWNDVRIICGFKSSSFTTFKKDNNWRCIVKESLKAKNYNLCKIYEI